MDFRIDRCDQTIKIVAVLFFLPSCANAYQVNCGDGESDQITVQSITSVLGEARPPCSGSGCPRVPTTFHTGTDIADCQTGFSVFAIEAGTITLSQGGVDRQANNWEIRIQSSDGKHAFDYVHLDGSALPAYVAVGSTITAGQLIGKIIGPPSTGNHLHLNDVDLSATPVVKRNPETSGYQGSLDFTDESIPDFSNLTLGGGALGDIVPIWYPRGGPHDSTNQSFAPLPVFVGNYVAAGVSSSSVFSLLTSPRFLR